MKYLVIFIAIILVGCGARSTTNIASTHQETGAAKADSIQGILADKAFKINFYTAYPQASRELHQINFSANGSSAAAVDITGGTYLLKVNKDTVFGYLPFYGKRYAGGHLGRIRDNAIKFKGIPTDYKSYRKEGEQHISFEIDDTNSAIGHHQIYLTVYDNGVAQMSVTSTQRSVMAYRGRVDRLKD